MISQEQLDLLREISEEWLRQDIGGSPRGTALLLLLDAYEGTVSEAKWWEFKARTVETLNDALLDTVIRAAASAAEPPVPEPGGK